MEQSTEYKNKVSRKKFLQVCGSILAGGSILGLSGMVLRNRMIASDMSSLEVQNPHNPSFASPYKLISSFAVPDQIDSFELYDDKLIVATSNNIFIYNQNGTLLNNFAVGSNLRDIAVENNHIFLLFPTQIEVYNSDGEWLYDWEACSEQSDYCSFTITSGHVFVTDAANKNICKYTIEGNFVTFINSPNRFIIPSYTFGITAINDIIYCANSGRHQIESYSLNGDYLGTFGKAGGAEGLFGGCCNPVHITKTATGEIITSEKGNPRISCYGSNGAFRSILLDNKLLGGGILAYDVKIKDDKLFIAGKNLVSTYKYDTVLASKTACSDCGVNCPLRKGVTI